MVKVHYKDMKPFTIFLITSLLFAFTLVAALYYFMYIKNKACDPVTVTRTIKVVITPSPTATPSATLAPTKPVYRLPIRIVSPAISPTK